MTNAATSLGIAVALLLGALPARLASAAAPSDLWTPDVIGKIRDRRTLGMQLVPRDGYFEVFYNSEVGDASWADSEPPYAVHTGDTIRIHGYLAFPPAGGPYPALVLGHGHGGHGDPDTARIIASFGYVVLSIDGPRAGQSTGGPEDTNQAWISVEKVTNQPSPEVGFLYHYAYAGMRGLTLLDQLSRLPFNPFHIDRTKLGVLGASMGGQFTYYINGIDDRVKAAVAVAVAGDWHHQVFYEGSWLYHGLYYYTRDGVRSGVDALNTVSDVCTDADPTIGTFLSYFDPIAYAPTQHGPLLTIIGTHDQYFTLPGINTTYDRVASAGTDRRFIKRILFTANGSHPVLDGDRPLQSILEVLGTVVHWLRYAFNDGPAPPPTPTIQTQTFGNWFVFRVAAPPGSVPLRRVDLYFATQLDSTVTPACDFNWRPLFPSGGEYVGVLPRGFQPRCGPAVAADNLLFYASAKDEADYTISSKMYYQLEPMEFCTGFVPDIGHFPGDDLTVPAPPGTDCSCTPLTRN